MTWAVIVALADSMSHSTKSISTSSSNGMSSAPILYYCQSPPGNRNTVISSSSRSILIYRQLNTVRGPYTQDIFPATYLRRNRNIISVLPPLAAVAVQREKRIEENIKPFAHAPIKTPAFPCFNVFLRYYPWARLVEGTYVSSRSRIRRPWQ